MPLIDELTALVGRTAGLSPAEASAVVTAVLRLLAARLPSPLFGELQTRLAAGGDAAVSPPDA